MTRSSTYDEQITFNIQVDTPELDPHSALVDWIVRVIENEGKQPGQISISIMSDEMLYDLNVEFLDHHSLTDILTFPYSYEPISADILISIDRVRENALNFNVSPREELRRVIIHGVLHMCGYDDSSDAEKSQMRHLEQKYLDLI